MSERGGILVFLQSLGEGLHPTSEKVAEIAAGLALEAGCPLGYVRAADGESAAYCGELLAAAIDAVRPEAVLVGSTGVGKIAASIAAVRFDAGIAADCTELRLLADMSLLQRRPAFGGDVTALVETVSRPQIVTVRPDIVSGAKGADFLALAAEVKPQAAAASGYRVTERRELTRERGIEEAGLIIAVGGGVSSAETVEQIKAVADRLGAEIAGSRVIVQRGWLPPERQIGLSGRAVSPELLITLGVSGSQQFLAGIGGSGYVIAVNTDERAPILARANQAILCDVNELLASLSLTL